MPKSKDRSRGELEKLRELSFKEKLQYIWSYYSYFIIGGTATIALIVSLVTTCANQKVSALYIVWEYIYAENSEALDPLAGELAARLLDDDSDEVIDVVQWIVPDATNYQMVSAYIERQVAMISAGVIDIFLLNETGLDRYSANMFLLPLSDIISDIEFRAPDVYERISDCIVYRTFDNYDDPETTEIAGIALSGSPLFSRLFDRQDFSLFDEPYYFSVSVSSNQIENITLALIELFSE